MIVKIKLGDLTARQVVKICEAAGQCVKCPIRTVPSDALCPYHDVDIEKYLDNEVEVSTDVLNPEMAESYETKFAELKAMVGEDRRRVSVIENTLLHLTRILGYNFGGVDPKCLRMRIIKSDHTLPPDEPYEAKPKVCVEDEEQ